MVEQIISKCQVTSKQYRKEPVKVTDIPKKLWQIIAVDFGGPYPDGQRNVVAIEKRTKYLKVTKTYSKAFRPTMEKLKTMFATHGTPRQPGSDNGPSFNSNEFEQFVKNKGLHHRRVTPEHARTNREAESFMKLLNKTEEIAHLQGRDNSIAIQEMLTGYRSSPRPAVGVMPYESLINRQVRTSLDYQTEENSKESTCDKAINRRGAAYKEKIKQNGQNKNT